MLRLITIKDCKDVQDIAGRLRSSFATVFSHHYAQKIHRPKAPGDEKTVADPGELINSKESIPPELKGFKDILSKPQYFPKGIHSYTQQQIQRRLFQLYFGPGFDDEVAFLLAFHDLKNSGLDAQTHYANKKLSLTKDQCNEVDDYLPLLESMGRTLKEVNFLALIDTHGIVHGFALFHVLQEGDQTILHIRQGAMLEKGRGYASAMARHFADNYPTAIYEANQRKANQVSMKEMLIREELIDVIPPVLGYKPEFYQGLRARANFQKVVLHHYRNNRDKLDIRKPGQFWEAESIPHRFFNAAKLQKDLLAFEDDNHMNDDLSYLRRSSVK